VPQTLQQPTKKPQLLLRRLLPLRMSLELMLMLVLILMSGMVLQ
jgi:hypothetical protein